MFGVVPQEFVEETDTLRRGGMVLKKGTRDQVGQTHCKTEGQSILRVIAPALYSFVRVSYSISSFLYDPSRKIAPETVRYCGVFYDENRLKLPAAQQS